MRESNYIMQVYKNDQRDCPEIYWYIKLKAAKEAGNRMLNNKNTLISAYRILKIDNGHYNNTSPTYGVEVYFSHTGKYTNNVSTQSVLKGLNCGESVCLRNPKDES